METEAADYVYSAALIGVVLAATSSLLWVAEGWLHAVLGSYAAIGMLALFAIGYGGFTAVLLAVVSSWLPLREGDYPMDHPQFRRWKVRHVVGELGKVALGFLPRVRARLLLCRVRRPRRQARSHRGEDHRPAPYGTRGELRARGGLHLDLTRDRQEPLRPARGSSRKGGDDRSRPAS